MPTVGDPDEGHRQNQSEILLQGYRSEAVSEEDAGQNDSIRVSRADAGWYPDPKGSGNLFYWDGSKWTGAVRGPPAVRPRSARGIEASHGLVIGGGAALAISPFLSWVRVFLLGNLSLFQLLEVAGSSKGLAWGAVLAGLGAAGIALVYRAPSTTLVVGLVVGLLGAALAILALVGLRHDVRETDGFAAVGLGAYIAIGGCGAMVIGALLSLPPRRTNAPK